MSNDKGLLYLIVVCTLSFIMIAVVMTMMIGVFAGHVDNKAVFNVIGPAFQGVVGAFTVLLTNALNNKAKMD